MTTSAPVQVASTPHSASYRAIAALLLGVSAVFANIYATQPILPVLSQEFGVSPAISGLTISAVVASIGIAVTLYGPLSDRIGRKPVMVWTSAALVLPTLGVALAPTFPVLLLCRLLQGLLIPGTTAVAVALIQEELPAAWRGAATGAWVSATTTGGMAGRVLAGFVADLIGWRWAFVITAVITALGATLMARWLPTPARRATVPPATHSPHTSLARTLAESYRAMFRFTRHRQILGAALIGCTLFFAFMTVFTFMPYRVAAPPFSLGPAATGSLFFVYAIGTIITPWAGRRSDYLGRRVTLGGAIGLIAIGLALTALPILSLTILALIAISCGLFAAQAIVTALVGDYAANARGSASAYYFVWYYFGATISPPLSGLVWQTFGWSGLLVVCFVALSLALTSLIVLCGP